MVQGRPGRHCEPSQEINENRAGVCRLKRTHVAVQLHRLHATAGVGSGLVHTCER
jgi:hypothetical protein